MSFQIGHLCSWLFTTGKSGEQRVLKNLPLPSWMRDRPKSGARIDELFTVLHNNLMPGFTFGFRIERGCPRHRVFARPELHGRLVRAGGQTLELCLALSVGISGKVELMQTVKPIGHMHFH